MAGLTGGFVRVWDGNNVIMCSVPITRHPATIAWAVSLLAAFIGATTLYTPTPGLYAPSVTSAVTLAAGLAGCLCAVWLPHRPPLRRALVSAAGGAISAAFLLRGLSACLTAIYGHAPVELTLGYLLAGLYLCVLSYLTYVAWNDLIVPWVELRAEL